MTVVCRVLRVSRSGFYGFLAEPETQRELRDETLAAKVRTVFVEHQGRYGSPRVCRELRYRGDRVSAKKVAEVMRDRGLVARRKKRFRATTDSKHDDPIAPNPLARDLTATAPNKAWVTDVTAVWTRRGWLFVAVLLDLFSRRAVGWATSMSNDRALALDALRAALVVRRPARGLLHHSDRGSPYASADYRRALERAGAVASMIRKGDCWDNAVAESFFATLKTEAFGDPIPDDPDEATRIVGEYVDGYYNPKRRRSYNDHQIPIGVELKRQVAAMAAWSTCPLGGEKFIPIHASRAPFRDAQGAGLAALGSQVYGRSTSSTVRSSRQPTRRIHATRTRRGGSRVSATQREGR